MANFILKEDLLKKLQQFTTKFTDDNKVIAVFLFGSHATGRPTLLSDIDLALLLNKSVERELYLAERLRLMGELSTILGTDSIDLIILNEASPALGYRVIRDGVLIYLKEEVNGQLVEFKARTMDRYFDYQPAQRIFSEGLARRIREGSFGGR